MSELDNKKDSSQSVSNLISPRPSNKSLNSQEGEALVSKNKSKLLSLKS